MKRLRSKILMIAGAVLIIVSAALGAYNRIMEKRGNEGAETIRTELEQIMEEHTDSIKGGSIRIGDDDYIGILEIPKINVKLPISRDWSYELMKESLCRYRGNLESKNMIICGHNMSGFFGELSEVYDGDEVYYTDVTGKVTRLVVVDTEYIDGYDVGSMLENNHNWDMTLFTCNYTGKMRYGVRCVIADGIE